MSTTCWIAYKRAKVLGFVIAHDQFGNNEEKFVVSHKTMEIKREFNSKESAFALVDGYWLAIKEV